MGCSNSNVNEKVPKDKKIKNLKDFNPDLNDKAKIYNPQNYKDFESNNSKEINTQIINKNFERQIISLNQNNIALTKKKEGYNLTNKPNNKLKKKLKSHKSEIKNMDVNNKLEKEENDSSYRSDNDSSYFAKEMYEEAKKKNNNKIIKTISSVNSSELSSDRNEPKDEINNNVENDNINNK